MFTTAPAPVLVSPPRRRAGSLAARVSRPLSARVLASLLAGAVAAGGFTASSCAAPRLPGGSGHALRAASSGYELQVLVDGVPAPTFQHAGDTHILGRLGARYTLRIVNHTGRRIEAVVSVDGRDAIGGRPADLRANRGYLIPAWGSVEVDGWRLSRAEVAAFRFSAVADSYAARTGSARDVGVIGVAVFPERVAPPPPRPLYTPPRYPRRGGNGSDDARGLGAAPRSSGAAADGASASEGGRSTPQAPSSEFAPEKAGAPEALPSAKASRAPAPATGRGDADALARSEAGSPPRRRSGLGTEFGEAVSSPVQEVSFARANASHPTVVLGARYNDRDGLLALGIDVDGCCGDRDDDLAWRQSATPFPAGADRRYAAPPSGWQRGCCVGY